MSEAFVQNILIVGNCQTQQMETLLRLLPNLATTRISVTEMQAGALAGIEPAGFDTIVVQASSLSDFKTRVPDFAALADQVIVVPTVQFRGYHPDFTHIRAKTGERLTWTSRIAMNGFAAGLSAEEIAALYSSAVFTEMGYYAAFEDEKAMFLSVLGQHLADPLLLFETWHDLAESFYVPNHPTMRVTRDVLAGVAAGRGLELPPAEAVALVNDPLKEKARYPTLNHPRSANPLERADHRYVLDGALFTRIRFVRRVFRQLEEGRAGYDFSDIGTERFQKALAAHRAETRVYAVNPYKTEPSRAFWKTAVADPDPAAVAPASHLRPVIGRQTRVATAGSCFAYHIARTLQENALDYFVAEPPPAELSPEIAAERGYGTFSARYGNIYTPRQLRQLFERAYGRFDPRQTGWRAKQGGWIDPFRPNIGETFANRRQLLDVRAAHLAAVRRMFEELDVFVFTLGLTECWTDAVDGSAFPVAPGVVADEVPADRIRFENFGPAAVVADMTAFLTQLKTVNPGAQVILTVSPVPLIATYSGQDVLAATTYSKSVLRAAAGHLTEAFGFVQYFPSYEIVTGAHARGRYFEPDLRSVTPEGVAHVMRVFLDTMVGGEEDDARLAAPVADFTKVRLSESYQADAAYICDEELAVREI